MPIFEHTSYSDPRNSGCRPHPHTNNCPYCKAALKSLELRDKWPIRDDTILSEYSEIIPIYKDFHGLEDCYLNLAMETKSTDVYIDFCLTCGWWRLVKNFCIAAEAWQIWDIFFECVGGLKELDMSDINLPIEEIGKYLIANYQARYSINPRIFEQVVGDVMKSMGYNVHVTGYSNDGGIDIVLGNASNEMVGVQVKRYGSKIKVEQIRAFAGALILGGFCKGIFVTTSSYQPGAVKAANQFLNYSLPIELVNAKTFYEALKISQRIDFDTDYLYSLINVTKIPTLYDYGCITPRNSL